MITRLDLARPSLVLTAALVMGACGDSTGLDSLNDPVLRDMAVVAADATLEDVNTWALPYAFGVLGAQAVPGFGGAGEGHGSPGGHFGLGHERSGTASRAFFDAAGNQQDAYDALTTERIEVVTMVGGEVTREGWSAMMSRERNMIVTGLAGEETHRTVNGSGSEAMSGSRHTEDGDRTYDMSGAFSYADVVVPIPGSDPRYPISGTISRSMNSTRTDDAGSETRTVDITITFDGDDTATMVVNGESVEVDLTAREGRFPLRGGMRGGMGRRPGG